MSPMPTSLMKDMPDADFRRFRDLIYDQCGINLTSVKKTMLTSRLRKRVRALGMDSFGEYYTYVMHSAESSQELLRMLDAVTTNKTDFFREPTHFDYLKNAVLPAFVQEGRWRRGRKLNLWSAACSTGEEPYSMAMVVADYASRYSGGDFSVLASDLSTEVLETARRAIYPEEAVRPVPHDLRRAYLMRGVGSKTGYCRVVPELRKQVSFRRVNLNSREVGEMRVPMDIIFCRNVVIYFDRETQKKLFEEIYHCLLPGGYLFIGHSESLHGISDRFESVAGATYRKP